MRFQSLSTVALAGTAIASPVATINARNTTTPCGAITALYKQYYSDPKNAGDSLLFDPVLANQCLLSSTIDNGLASSFVSEYKKYIEFQTTLAYLKAPPANYSYPAVDILGSLDALATKAASGGFSSQYLLDQALTTLVSSAHEGHLYQSFCTDGTIGYQRNVNLVSISKDGVALPEIFVLDDILAGGNAYSNVVSINGQNAASLIQQEALRVSADPDASYNAMFWSHGRVPSTGSNFGGFYGLPTSFYPGPFTNVTFANGTTIPYPNTAFINQPNWSEDVIDGASFTDIFCIKPAQAVQATATSVTGSASPTANATPANKAVATESPSALPQLFPYTPVVRDPNNQVAGYFLNGSDYQDTAVLWVGTFDQENPAYADQDTVTESFVNTTRDFFAALRSSTKTKLIIDLSGNPGGNTLLPDDLFKRLFPGIEPYGAARARVPTAAQIWGESFAAIPNSLAIPTEQEVEAGTFLQPALIWTNIFDYRGHLTAALKNFTGWADFYPPNVQYGDNFTANYRAPLNNSLYTEFIDSLDVYDMSDDGPVYPQPFPSQDIVILTDGLCASACSIFTELMTRQANVKTIAVGGRPQIAPMQAIGGTKGSMVQPFSNLQQTSQFFMNNTKYIPANLLATAKDTFPGLVPLPLGSPTALSKYNLNAQDNVPLDDPQQIPLQFVFEPADCKIFYTAQTLLNPNALWAYVHDVAWKGQACAWGSVTANSTVVAKTGNNTSAPTNYTQPSVGPGGLQVKNDASGSSTIMSGMFVIAGIMAFLMM